MVSVLMHCTFEKFCGPGFSVLVIPEVAGIILRFYMFLTNLVKFENNSVLEITKK